MIDHRELARDMGIFISDPLVGSGLPLWLPAGSIVREELEAYAHELAAASGCVGVHTPLLAKRALFERSGHWDKFHDDMFAPMDVGGEEFVLRPANCPHHAVLYAAQQHSWRDLPVRYNELAAMFRSERSGVLSGMSRVRQINLDDTHVFCRADQIREEAALALQTVLKAYAVLGIDVAYVRLSRRGDGPGYLGSMEQWADAEGQLREVIADLDLEGRGISWQEASGEAAFYGPKLDVQVHDARGQEESLSTVQVDMVQPERFDLSYVASDGSRQRPVMIHRGVLGAMERMVAFLLEIHAGRLPLWLAPVQVCLLPVAGHHVGAAESLAAQLVSAGLRVRVDRDGSVGARVRSSRTRRDAVIAVIGDEELATGAVCVTDPKARFVGNLARDPFVSLLAEAARARDHLVPWPAQSVKTLALRHRVHESG